MTRERVSLNRERLVPVVLEETNGVFLVLLALAVLSAVLLSGCGRGETFEDPPIHLVTNMDEQPKYKTQSESRFHADGLAMREPVEGTVARGWLREDVAFFTGKHENGRLVQENPLIVNAELLVRGKERFGIFCAPCHGPIGDGKSKVVEKGMQLPPNFHLQRLRDTADGHFYDVITNGVRNMPPYKYQIPVEDRWAIVGYLRALQQEHPVAPEPKPEAAAKQ